MRPITFRVESNKSKTKHWYTLVAGNGDTVMTSKTSYRERSAAKRAAKRTIKALRWSPPILEYVDQNGALRREQVKGSGPSVVTKIVHPATLTFPVAKPARQGRRT